MSQRLRRYMNQLIFAVALLNAGGIAGPEDLMILENDDIALLLPRASVLERRKLSNIAEHLAAGILVTSTKIFSNFMLSLLRWNQRKGTTPSTIDLAVRGAPKLYVDGLETFDGIPIKWESWEIGTFATSGQTIVMVILSHEAIVYS
jgi:hypothetical protein